MTIRHAQWTLVGALGLLLSAPPAGAMTFVWTGTTQLVDVDTGAGRFTGNGVGSTYAGVFAAGDSCGVGCTTSNEPDEADYEFELGTQFGGGLSDGVTVAVGDVSYINVQNDHAVDADEAALLGFLFGGLFPVGTLIDVWTIGAESNAVYDAFDDELVDGGFVEVAFVSLDTSVLDDTSFRPSPPDFSGLDPSVARRVFVIEEAEPIAPGVGETVFLAFGTVDSFDVPEPSALALLAAGGLALVGARRRGRTET